MKKRAMKKLILSRETLKPLQDMPAAVGGVLPTTSDCFTYCIPCQTTVNLPCGPIGPVGPVSPGPGSPGDTYTMFQTE